jgi:SSS family solute:Na+ symporter
VYYCGLNQFIVQRTLAAKSLKQGQLGIVFAAALWLIVPFSIVLPGIMSHQLYADQLSTAPDKAFPMLVRNLIPEGIRGFLLAAIAGAVISALSGVLNSASTIFTMDIYNRMINPRASQKRLVVIGRVATLVFVVLACLAAPELGRKEFKGVFNFIQEFQGYISPGILASFLVGFIVKRAPPAAGIVAIPVNAVTYGALHMLYGNFSWSIHPVHYLTRMLWTFCTVVAVMLIITIVRPRSEPAVIPVRKDIHMSYSPLAMFLGLVVIVAVVAFHVVFW